MTRFLPAFLLGFGLLFHAAAGVAQELQGEWDLINEDGSQSCSLVLSSEAVADRFKVTSDGRCAAVFPEAGDITSWASKGGRNLDIFDSNGTRIFSFSGVGEDMLAATASTGLAYLAPVGGGGGGTVTAEDMTGVWSFSRSEDGEPICAADFLLEEAGEGRMRLALLDRCDSAIVQTGIASWNLEAGVLSLFDAAGKKVLTFSEEGGAWKRDPAGSRPLFLILQTE
ncbi:MAG: AprI/Inh family metalloprotease inhibitor [Flavobacteriaceae bacterium]